ncbi:MAG TPA: hypothetical protein VKP30_21645, partial [Polyangiaceae bacterium]|nr:hypothetical protein [Polyangiaceae bacterium]
VLQCSGEEGDRSSSLLFESPLVAAAGQSSHLAGSDQPRTEAFHNGGAAGALGNAAISAFVRLNEVKFDPPGNDGGDEFLEIEGEPLTSVGRRWLVALEGDLDANPGKVDLAIDLSLCAASSCHFDERGLLVLVTDRKLVPSVTSLSRESVELANGALENGTTTLLVLDAPPDFEPGAADWDADDNGLLELPDGCGIEDSVSWTDGGNDLSYASTLLGPKPKPQAAWRCHDASGGDFWSYGQLIGDSRSLTIDPGSSTPVGVDGPALTPGAPNLCSEPVSAVAVGGHQGLAENSTFEAPASAGKASRSDAIGGCSGMRSVIVPRGGRSATPDLAASEAGSVSIQIVHAAPGQAGTPGWWSPDPFATPLVQAAGYDAGGALPLAPGRASGGLAVIPAMPSGCDTVPSSGRRPVPFCLLALGFAFAARQRRKARSPAPQAKEARAEPGNSQMPCAKPAIPLYAPSKNVEPSDLECAPTP